MVSNFDTCRLCLQENVPVVDIFETIAATDPEMIICDVLMKYACVQVAWNDGLSSKICTTCKHELQRMARFRIMCELSALKYQSTPIVKSESVTVKLEADTNLESSFSSLMAMDTCGFDDVICKTDEIYNISTVKNENEMDGDVADKGDDDLDEMGLLHSILDISIDMKEEFRSDEVKSQGSTNKSEAVTPKVDKDIAPPSPTLYPFECNFCHATFRWQSQLQNHKKKRRSKCAASKESDKSTSSSHEQVCNPDKTKKLKGIRGGKKHFACDICEKTFTLKQYLQAHERTHTGSRPYECNKCGKCFTQHSALNTHLALHSGAKPHSCKECGKRFALRSYLKQHEMVHTSERPHKCTTCGKSFKQKSTLLTHEKNCAPD